RSVASMVTPGSDVIFCITFTGKKRGRSERVDAIRTEPHHRRVCRRGQAAKSTFAARQCLATLDALSGAIDDHVLPGVNTVEQPGGQSLGIAGDVFHQSAGISDDTVHQMEGVLKYVADQV